MPDELEPPAAPAGGESPSLDERKFDLELQKFEFEKSKSRGLGFFNSNLGIIITFIVGISTVLVSYLQLRISNQSAGAQLDFQRQASEQQMKLEREKAQAAKEKDDRAFQFDLARLLLEKASDLNTDDEKRVPYLRDIVLTTLPADIGIKITRKMADDAPNSTVRSVWNDAYVSLQLSVAAPTTGQQEISITVDYVITKFPQLASEDGRKRLTELLAAAREFNLGDTQANATFLAYIFFQTDFFRATVENLNYQSAERLMAVFPKSFSSVSDAAEFVGSAERIANKVYDGRLGNVEAGDGWRFRGRGYLQTAGRSGYASSGMLIGVDLVAHPDALLDSTIAAREAAARFAQLRDRHSISSVVRTLNGGYVGLAEAQAIFEKLVPEAPKVTEGLTITPAKAR